MPRKKQGRAKDGHQVSSTSTRADVEGQESQAAPARAAEPLPAQAARTATATRREIPVWQELIWTGAIAVVSGLVAGGVFYLGQMKLDDERIAREHQREDRREALATRLENLRFVRALSSIEDVDRPFAALDLEGMNLSGLNLEGADFSNANLRGANFSKTNLKNVLLESADLTGANFGSAILSGIVMDLETNVDGVDFSGANLDGAILRSPSGRATWDDASLVGATVGWVDFGDTSRLSNAGVIGAEFIGVDLSTIEIVASDNLQVRFCVDDLVAPFKSLENAEVTAANNDCWQLNDFLSINLRIEYGVSRRLHTSEPPFLVPPVLMDDLAPGLARSLGLTDSQPDDAVMVQRPN